MIIIILLISFNSCVRNMDPERLTSNEIRNLMHHLQKLMVLSRTCENSNVGDCVSNNKTSSTSSRDQQIHETNEQPPIPSTSSGNIRKRKSPMSNEIITKKPRHDEKIRQISAGNAFATISIPTSDAIDLDDFLNGAKDEICGIISNELNERKALKFYLSVNLELERTSVDGVVTTTTPYMHSLPSIVLESTYLDEEFQTASDRLKEL